MELYNQDIVSFKVMCKTLKPKKYSVIVIGDATYLDKEIKQVISS
ncbi:MAG: hypothetical protein ACUVQ1_05675 [Candidatus Kapaibacteriales bacterium]